MEVGADQIRSFFDAIPRRYDFLNSVLSFSIHWRWRKRLVREALKDDVESFLDIGAGTGTSLKTFLDRKTFRLAVGCDFSEGMLKVAEEKLTSAKLVQSDACHLSFKKGSFDLVTSSFVLRSLGSLDQFMSEVKRVLKKRGRFAFLELTRPKHPIVWNVFVQPYLRFYLPLVGRIVSGHNDAYQFLSNSIQSFQDPEILKRRFEEMGFSSVQLTLLSGGLGSILIGQKD